MSLLLEQFEALLTTPEAVDALNAQFLAWAVQGKLLSQNSEDEPASILLKNIESEKKRLIKSGQLRKSNTLPIIKADDLPHLIPETWEWVRLGNIASYGNSEKADPSILDDSIWVLDLADIEKETSKLLERVRYKDRPFKSSKNWFHEGDVLYGKLRPYLDKVLVADENGVCTTEIIPIRGYDGIYPHYLRLALKNPYFLDYVNSKTYGVKMPRLGTTDGKMTPIPLPPLAEQKRIVVKVESLLAQTAAIKERLIWAEKEQRKLNQSALAHLTGAENPAEFSEQWAFIKDNFDLLYSHPDNVAELKQSILQLAVQGRLVKGNPDDEPASELLKKILERKRDAWDERNETGKKRYKEPTIPDLKGLPKLPSGWVWATPEQFCDGVNNGSTPKADLMSEDNGDVPFLKVYNLTFDGSLDFSIKPTFISFETHKTSLKRSTTYPGDVLTNIVGPPLGKVSIVQDTYPEWNINQAIVTFRVKQNIYNKFLSFVLQAPQTIERLTSITRGTAGQDNIRLSTCRTVALPIPPLAEQKRIVEKLERIFKILDELEAGLVSARESHARVVRSVLGEVG